MTSVAAPPHTAERVAALRPVRSRVAKVGRPGVGELIRDWRTRRKYSQLDVSSELGVSTRHLSFVETGRSRPSPELILTLADFFEVPLRERNTMLLAAGYAPRYAARELSDPSMVNVTASLQRMLDAHDPYPGVVVDRQWNVLLTNTAAGAFTGMVADELLSPVNVFRICLHPDGLAPYTVNFEDWAAYLLRQLRRSIQVSGDPALIALEEEVTTYPTLAGTAPPTETSYWDDPPLLVPFTLAFNGAELSFFTTLTTFGTPLDITLDELAVELFFPADDATDSLLRQSPGSGSGQ
jgi:transcriptional regulator with XRE-family HTH domain